MGEENKRNMAEQGGTCLGEIQREGVGGNLFEGDAWQWVRVKGNWWEWLYSKEERAVAEQWAESEVWTDCWDAWQETGNGVSSYATVVPGRGGGRGRKEQSREVGATPQLHQHYCSLPEWGPAHLFYSESCSLLKFQTGMHWCQHKYSQLDQPRSS